MQHFTCDTVADLAVPGLAGGRLTVLALSGVVDAASRDGLAAALAAAGSAQLVVDLSGLRLLSSAGAEVLCGAARTGAAHGRALRLAGCPAQAAAVLARAAEDRAAPEQYASVAAALAAVIAAAVAAPVGTDPDLTDRYLRADALRLRHAVHGRALDARAEGVLTERYGLRGPTRARGLLRSVAREHGLATVELAAAVAHTPPPRPGEKWFPGDGPAAPPAVRFVSGPRDRTLSLSAFLDALRDAVCGITHTDMANVQLIDADDHTLRMESHCGYPAEFVRFFAVVDDTTTACGQAARKSARVVVDDVATASVFDEPSRAAVLAVHIRSVQCTPIPGVAGGPQGMVSTHHTRPGHTYTPGELDALDGVAREAGEWLDWYRGSRLEDALEDLHRRAQSPSA
ncbi:STAS domain-containing protein [Streptomyces sp900105245]|uniref:STAS domain-containing protein n=1 Tax=Streptomyces sp. 900105245 TaxID=3154379 RepID=UPI00332C2E38